MKIFTRKVRKEVKAYLPHYIIGTCLLTVAILFSNLVTLGIAKGLNLVSVGEQPAAKQEQKQANTGKAPSKYRIGKPYQKALKDKSKPIVAVFFADWCPHCQRFVPIFAKASRGLKEVNPVAVNAEDPENYELTQKFEINKFPTILIIDPKTERFEEITLYQNAFNKDGLIKLIKREAKKFDF